MKFLFFVLISNVVQTPMRACGLVPLMIYHINVVTFKNKTKQKSSSMISKELFLRQIAGIRDDRIILNGVMMYI